MTAAMSAVGGCGTDHAWRFPLRQAGLKFSSEELVDTWDRVNDGRSVAMLEELMVRRIRQWRPEVMVTEAASPRGDRPLSHIINQLVLVGGAQCSGPHLASRSRDRCGPAALDGQESIRRGRRGRAGHGDSDDGAAWRRLGCSVADQAAEGYSLVSTRYEPVPVDGGFSTAVG